MLQGTLVKAVTDSVEHAYRTCNLLKLQKGYWHSVPDTENRHENENYPG